MVRRISCFAMLLYVFSSMAPLHAQFPQIPGFEYPSKSNSGSPSGVDETQAVSGVKEALAVGTQRAVAEVARPGGYLDNQAIKILVPQNLRPMERGLRDVGQGPKVDEFVASMNHAAESAAPEAGKIFGDAVRQMTISDAKALLTGGDTSITDYFKAKTSAQLAVAFRPHVVTAMNANGVAQKYNALMSQVPQMPFMNSSSMDINTYVVNKALDGLFYMLAQQEKQIRQNPAARTTALLKQVFGAR
jgi:hypothetical protein